MSRPKTANGAVAPLLEAVVDGHPDVKVELRLGDVVAGQQLAEAGGVLLQHVPVVLPSAAVREHLQQRPPSLKIQVRLSPGLQTLTHARVQISNISSFSILVSDFNVLVGPRVNHHVPGVPVQPVSPVVVALQRRERKEILLYQKKKKSNFYHSVCGSRAYLGDEVGIRHEKLLKDVQDCESSSQLVLESWFGGSCSRRGLLAFAAAVGVAVNTGGAGLRAR